MERLTDEEARHLLKIAHGVLPAISPGNNPLTRLERDARSQDELLWNYLADINATVMTERGRRLLDEYLNDVKVPMTSPE